MPQIALPDNTPLCLYPGTDAITISYDKQDNILKVDRLDLLALAAKLAVGGDEEVIIPVVRTEHDIRYDPAWEVASRMELLRLGGQKPPGVAKRGIRQAIGRHAKGLFVIDYPRHAGRSAWKEAIKNVHYDDSGLIELLDCADKAGSGVVADWLRDGDGRDAVAWAVTSQRLNLAEELWQRGGRMRACHDEKGRLTGTAYAMVALLAYSPVNMAHKSGWLGKAGGSGSKLNTKGTIAWELDGSTDFYKLPQVIDRVWAKRILSEGIIDTNTVFPIDIITSKRRANGKVKETGRRTARYTFASYLLEFGTGSMAHSEGLRFDGDVTAALEEHVKTWIRILTQSGERWVGSAINHDVISPDQAIEATDSNSGPALRAAVQAAALGVRASTSGIKARARV